MEINCLIILYRYSYISVQKDWGDYLTPIVVPILGLYIAYRQWRTEEAKLRHEIFERRYKKFYAVTKFAYSVISLNIKADEEYTTYESGDNLVSEIAGIRFILNLEIEQYVGNHIILSILYDSRTQIRL